MKKKVSDSWASFRLLSGDFLSLFSGHIFLTALARSALSLTATFLSGCSLECVIRGANNRPGHSGHSMWAALN